MSCHCHSIAVCCADVAMQSDFAQGSPVMVSGCACLQVLVVSEVDRVHPVLHPLLRKDLQKQAGRLVRTLTRLGVPQQAAVTCRRFCWLCAPAGPAPLHVALCSSPKHTASHATHVPVLILVCRWCMWVSVRSTTTPPSSCTSSHAMPPPPSPRTSCPC